MKPCLPILKHLLYLVNLISDYETSNFKTDGFSLLEISGISENLKRTVEGLDGSSAVRRLLVLLGSLIHLKLLLQCAAVDVECAIVHKDLI